MSANLEEAIRLVYCAEPNLHSIEKTILDQFENPAKYYYNAIYLIVNHYGDLVPFNPIPTINTFIRPGTQVHLVLSYSQEEFIASVIFLPDFVLEQFREAKSSHDLSQLTRNSFGEIRFSPQGEVELVYGHLEQNGFTNVQCLTQIKNLWKNGQVDAELTRILKDLVE